MTIEGRHITFDDRIKKTLHWTMGGGGGGGGGVGGVGSGGGGETTN